MSYSKDGGNNEFFPRAGGISPSPLSPTAPTPPAPTPPSPTPVPLGPRPIHYYKFNGDGVDSIGDLDLDVNTSATFVTGKLSQAISIDSSINYGRSAYKYLSEYYDPVSDSHYGVLSAVEWTITFWAKVTNLANFQILFRLYSYTSFYVLKNNIVVFYDPNYGTFFYNTDYGDGSFGPSVSADTWYFITIRFSSGVIGFSVNTGSETTVAPYAYTDVYQYFSSIAAGSYVDDLRIYDTYIGTTEISNIYNGGSATSIVDPISSTLDIRIATNNGIIKNLTLASLEGEVRKPYSTSARARGVSIKSNFFVDKIKFQTSNWAYQDRQASLEYRAFFENVFNNLPNDTDGTFGVLNLVDQYYTDNTGLKIRAVYLSEDINPTSYSGLYISVVAELDMTSSPYVVTVNDIKLRDNDFYEINNTPTEYRVLPRLPNHNNVTITGFSYNQNTDTTYFTWTEYNYSDSNTILSDLPFSPLRTDLGGFSTSAILNYGKYILQDDLYGYDNVIFLGSPADTYMTYTLSFYWVSDRKQNLSDTKIGPLALTTSADQKLELLSQNQKTATTSPAIKAYNQSKSSTTSISKYLRQLTTGKTDTKIALLTQSQKTITTTPAIKAYNQSKSGTTSILKYLRQLTAGKTDTKIALLTQSQKTVTTTPAIKAYNQSASGTTSILKYLRQTVTNSTETKIALLTQSQKTVTTTPAIKAYNQSKSSTTSISKYKRQLITQSLDVIKMASNSDSHKLEAFKRISPTLQTGIRSFKIAALSILQVLGTRKIAEFLISTTVEYSLKSTSQIQNTTKAKFITSVSNSSTTSIFKLITPLLLNNTSAQKLKVSRPTQSTRSQLQQANSIVLIASALKKKTQFRIVRLDSRKKATEQIAATSVTKLKAVQLQFSKLDSLRVLSLASNTKTNTFKKASLFANNASSLLKIAQRQTLSSSDASKLILRSSSYSQAAFLKLSSALHFNTQSLIRKASLLQVLNGSNLRKQAELVSSISNIIITAYRSDVKLNSFLSKISINIQSLNALKINTFSNNSAISSTLLYSRAIAQSTSSTALRTSTYTVQSDSSLKSIFSKNNRNYSLLYSRLAFQSNTVTLLQLVQNRSQTAHSVLKAIIAKNQFLSFRIRTATQLDYLSSTLSIGEVRFSQSAAILLYEEHTRSQSILSYCLLLSASSSSTAGLVKVSVAKNNITQSLVRLSVSIDNISVSELRGTNSLTSRSDIRRIALKAVISNSSVLFRFTTSKSINTNTLLLSGALESHSTSINVYKRFSNSNDIVSFLLSTSDLSQYIRSLNIIGYSKAIFAVGATQVSKGKLQSIEGVLRKSLTGSSFINASLFLRTRLDFSTQEFLMSSFSQVSNVNNFLKKDLVISSSLNSLELLSSVLSSSQVSFFVSSSRAIASSDLLILAGSGFYSLNNLFAVKGSFLLAGTSSLRNSSLSLSSDSSSLFRSSPSHASFNDASLIKSLFKSFFATPAVIRALSCFSISGGVLNLSSSLSSSALAFLFVRPSVFSRVSSILVGEIRTISNTRSLFFSESLRFYYVDSLLVSSPKSWSSDARLFLVSAIHGAFSLGVKDFTAFQSLSGSQLFGLAAGHGVSVLSFKLSEGNCENAFSPAGTVSSGSFFIVPVDVQVPRAVRNNRILLKEFGWGSRSISVSEFSVSSCSGDFSATCGNVDAFVSPSGDFSSPSGSFSWGSCCAAVNPSGSGSVLAIQSAVSVGVLPVSGSDSEVISPVRSGVVSVLEPVRVERVPEPVGFAPVGVEVVRVVASSGSVSVLPVSSEGVVGVSRAPVLRKNSSLVSLPSKRSL